MPLLTALITVLLFAPVQHGFLRHHVNELERRGIVKVWTCFEKNCHFVDVPVSCEVLLKTPGLMMECAAEAQKASKEDHPAAFGPIS